MKGFNNPPEAITRSYIATLVKVFVLAAFLVTAMQSSAFANPSFTLINHSGRTITGFYCGVKGSNDWKNNVIGPGGFPNGGVTTVRLGQNERYWGLFVRFSGGGKLEYYHLDVVTYGGVVVNPNSFSFTYR